MKIYLYLILFVFFSLEIRGTPSTKCVEGTSKVCTPFSYNGVSHDDCYDGWTSDWCLVDGQTGSGSDYSSCGECVSTTPTSTTTATKAPSTTTATKPPKCVKGTSKVCTPFSYKGVSYDDCYDGGFFRDDWCLVDGQTGSGSDYSSCGECVHIDVIPNTKTETTTKDITEAPTTTITGTEEGSGIGDTTTEGGGTIDDESTTDEGPHTPQGPTNKPVNVTKAPCSFNETHVEQIHDQISGLLGDDETEGKTENTENYKLLFMSYKRALPKNIFTKKLLRKMLKNIFSNKK